MIGGWNRYNLPGIGPFRITKETREESIKIYTDLPVLTEIVLSPQRT